MYKCIILLHIYTLYKLNHFSCYTAGLISVLIWCISDGVG